MSGGINRTGKVESYRLTTYGYQITTIAGEEYLTVWDARNRRWEIGDVVVFKTSPPPEGWNRSFAEILSRVTMWKLISYVTQEEFYFNSFEEMMAEKDENHSAWELVDDRVNPENGKWVEVTDSDTD